MSLLKEAYSLAAIAKQIKSAKRAGKIFNGRNINIVPNAAGDKYLVKATKSGGSGPFTIGNTYEKTPDSVKQVIEKHNLRKAVYDKDGGVHAFSKVLTNHHNTVSEFPEDVLKTINPKRIGSVREKDRHMPFEGNKGMSGEDRKAVNLLTHKHEQDELRAAKELTRHTKAQYGDKPRAFTWGQSGHLSPSVVLRESNAVRTLGKGTGGKELYHKAKAMFHYARKDAGLEQRYLRELVNTSRAPKAENVVFPAKNKLPTPASNHMDYEYGRTHLSRHAIKRLEQAALRKNHVQVHS